MVTTKAHDLRRRAQRAVLTATMMCAAMCVTMVAFAYADPDAIVSTEWLEANLSDPNVRIIEVSVIPGVYERGHIPGAFNIAWHTDLVDPVVRNIASPEAFQALARRAGINQGSTVVLYGDNNNWFAAWGAWVFEIYGVADVRILNGGRALWEAEGRPLSSVAEQPAAGNFTVIGSREAELRAFRDDVLSVVNGDVDKVLVDIRSVAEYEGRIFAPEGFQELAIRAGHIPGAANVPWAQAVNADGTFKSADELRALYGAAGVDGSKPIVVYCRIGERSSHTWFVLHRLLGYEVQQYDGSWTEWGNSVGVPITNLAGTVWGSN